MKLFAFKSIKTKLIFWFSIISIFPLATILIVIYNQQVHIIETQTTEKLIAIRDLKQKRLQNWLSERTGDLQTMSSDKELTDIEQLINNSVSEHQKNKILFHSRQIINRYLTNYDSYSEIFIIHPVTGKIIISTDTNTEGDDRSDREYYKKPIKSRNIELIDVYMSKHLSKNVMVYSVPIFCIKHDHIHIVGILAARIDLHNSLYTMLLDRVGLGKTGETLIVNKDVVALNELRYYENAPLNLKIEAEPAIRAANGETGIVKAEDYRGEDVLAAYTYIPETSWGFVCKQDMHELNKPIKNMLYNFLIIFLVTVIAIYIVSLQLSKTISKPIVEMDNIAQKIRQGELTVRNTVYSKDELGSLADNFNIMADALESRLKVQHSMKCISDTIVGKHSLKQFCNDLLQELMEVTKANMSAFYILNETSFEYEHFMSIGANEDMMKPFSATNPEGEFGNVVLTKNIQHLRDLPDDTIFKYRTTSGDIIPKEIISIPILIENTVVAIVSLVNVNRFDDESYDILSQSWININSSFSSLLSNERTRILAEQLSRINQQLESQAEELQAQAEELQSQSEELQSQNSELERQRKQVEESSRLKGEFLSNMSHELRTPLNSIMALSRALIMQAKDKLDDEENTYLEIVERNGKHLLVLINDILDLSKIEAGKMTINVKEISIKQILENVKDSLLPLAKEKNLKFTMNVQKELPSIVSDEAKLHQVFLNVVSNSIKFTEKGSVEISTTYDAERIKIEIADTGIGIPKHALPYIFEEFRQVDGSTSRQYEGTGLGLAIAHKLINILDGDIAVESTFNEGSTFTITLPIVNHKTYEDSAIKNYDSYGSTQIENGLKSVTFPKVSNNERILLVEDNNDIIIQMKLILEKEGFLLDVASGGIEALEYIDKTIPDGIILDLMMPEVDGFEVLSKIRSNPDTSKIPILILTAKDLTPDDFVRLNESNIQQLVRKGDEDIEGLIFKIRLMLTNEPKKS